MPVLKSQLAPPAMKEAIVLDLGDLGAQAERIRRQAEVRAEQTLADAQARADALVADAAAQADARGHAEGLARGLAEGQEQGRVQALAEAKPRLEELAAQWSATASRWEQQRLAMDRDAREAVLGFALRAAEKLTHRVIEVDAQTAPRQVGAALETVLTPHDLKVCIHPEDRPGVEEALPQLIAMLGTLGRVELIEDEAVGRGGCVITTVGGVVDAAIQTQLDRLTNLILPHDEAASVAAEAGGPEAEAGPKQAELGGQAQAPDLPQPPESDDDPSSSAAGPGA